MTRRSRNWVERATFLILVGALVLGILGEFFVDRSVRFELGVEMLALVAAITGIYAERWYTAHKRREQVLEALRTELLKNRDTLDGPSFSADAAVPVRAQPLPRLVMSAADVALNSGILHPVDDAGLIDQLHNWRNVVSGLNHLLDLVDMRTYITEVTPEEFQRNLEAVRRGRYVTGTRQQLETLLAKLPE